MKNFRFFSNHKGFSIKTNYINLSSIVLCKKCDIQKAL